MKLQIDKINHIIGSFFIVIVIQAPLLLFKVDPHHALSFAVFIALGLGIYKELRDPYFDREDILADVIGILIAIGLNFAYGFFV